MKKIWNKLKIIFCLWWKYSVYLVTSLWMYSSTVFIQVLQNVYSTTMSTSAPVLASLKLPNFESAFKIEPLSWKHLKFSLNRFFNNKKQEPHLGSRHLDLVWDYSAVSWVTWSFWVYYRESSIEWNIWSRLLMSLVEFVLTHETFYIFIWLPFVLRYFSVPLRCVHFVS